LQISKKIFLLKSMSSTEDRKARLAAWKAAKLAAQQKTNNVESNGSAKSDSATAMQGVIETNGTASNTTMPPVQPDILKSDNDKEKSQFQLLDDLETGDDDNEE